jgi:hypothetical protein
MMEGGTSYRDDVLLLVDTAMTEVGGEEYNKERYGDGIEVRLTEGSESLISPLGSTHGLVDTQEIKYGINIFPEVESNSKT